MTSECMQCTSCSTVRVIHRAVQAWARLIPLCGILLFAGGCALPTSGPPTQAFASGNGQGVPSVAVVDVSTRMLGAQFARPAPSLAATFEKMNRNVALRLARGDLVTVSLWEAPPGTLFSSSIISGQSVSNTSTINIPAQTVDFDGGITVPFAGRVSVIGETPSAVENKIRQALQGKASQPQALVTVVRSAANTVTVTGEVAGGSRVPISGGGDRILDAIAAAGGLRAPVHESIVELMRTGTTARVPFDKLVHSPRENLIVLPGDIITVVREPRTFSVLGATGRNADIVFEAPQISMAQALAKSGGLQDSRADATGVFLFRIEPVAVAKLLLPPNSIYLGPRNLPVPIAYRFNLLDPQTVVAMSRFWMQPGDVIYVSNASGAELQKFLQMIQGIVGPALNGAAVAITAR